MLKLHQIFNIFFIITFIFAIIGMIFGFRFNFVRSGSMEPTINTWDFVITKKINENECKKLKANDNIEPKNGDIIVFEVDDTTSPNSTVNLIIHRIIENDTKNKTITTKGDNNLWINKNEIKIPYKKIRYKHFCTMRYQYLLILISILIYTIIMEYKENNIKHQL